jgi:peptidoglycan/xylan/chitin deacetylase (PgdA/CDA1 family)
MTKKAHSILPQILYVTIHPILKRIFPDCLWDLTGELALALTFDDGPHPVYTSQVLEVLSQWDLKASFFVLGEQVELYPHVVAEILVQGHHIGIHGFRHDSFTRLTIPELKDSLIKTQHAIAKACHQPPETYRDVRPPNGLFFPKTLTYLRQWGYRPVMWSVVPEDWVNPPCSVVVSRILKQVYPGAIIVLHDGYYGGLQVAETLRTLIPSLIHRGFTFTTLGSFISHTL